MVVLRLRPGYDAKMLMIMIMRIWPMIMIIIIWMMIMITEMMMMMIDS